MNDVHTHIMYIIGSQCIECNKEFTFYRRKVCQHELTTFVHIPMLTHYLYLIPLYSISVVGVWMRCVTPVQSISYLLLTCHLSVKESVTLALASCQLAIEVRIILKRSLEDHYTFPFGTSAHS